MTFIKLKCIFCGKKFWRSRGRVNEAEKFGWKPYCSLKCQYKARITQVKMKCGNPDCNKMVARLKNQFEKSKSKSIFCSHHCAATATNRLRVGLVLKKKRDLFKICPVCGCKFWKDQKHCSMKCYANALRMRPRFIKISKQQIIEEIQDFYKKHGRIPVKIEYSHYCAAQERFGSWNNAILAAGFEPNPVMFAKKFVANDGHKCDSFSEKIIDDWLDSKNVEHKRDIPYPEDNSLKVDFATDNYWIEFFGLSGVMKRYDELKVKKIGLARKYDIRLIEVHPKDLYPINRLQNIVDI